MPIDALEAIRMARSSFLKCRSYAQGLVAGIEIDACKSPQAMRESIFGHWHDAAARGPLGRLTTFQALEPVYLTLTDHYTALHHLVRAGRQEQAQPHLEAVVDHCQRLLELLDLLERELQQVMQSQQ